MGHWLFAVDVFARPHRGDGHWRVPMVGGRHNHRVNILAVNNLTVVARGGRIGLNFLSTPEVAIV